MSPKIELLNIDCLEYMKTVPDKHFDLAIVDPPYNIVSQQKRGIGSRIDASGKMNDWNNEKPSPEYFKELFRVSEKQIIWGANNFMIEETEYFIVWDKMQTVENFASAEYAWTNIKMPAKVFRYSIHQHNCDKGDKIHPTMKPVKLYKWLLQNYATCNKCNNTGSMYEDVVGDGGSQMLVDCEWCDVAEKGRPKILDTHGGSMSIAIACHQMGFDLTLCEIDKDYYDAGVKRFKEQTKQLKLFQ